MMSDSLRLQTDNERGGGMCSGKVRASKKTPPGRHGPTWYSATHLS